MRSETEARAGATQPPRSLRALLPRSLRGRRARLKEASRVYLESPAVRIKLRAGVLRPYRRLRFQRFGSRSIVHKPEWLAGTHRIAIADEVAVLGRCWLAAERPSWSRPDPALSLGDRVAIGAFCVITAAESVVLEEDVSVASHAFISDVFHSLGDEEAEPPRPRLTAVNDNATMNAPIDSRPVRIGRGTWIGKGAAVLGGSEIGVRCIIGANSVVRGHVPDYSIAVGAPARVVGSTRGS